MPRKLLIGSPGEDDAARRLRAELRTSYGNKQSMLNINRLRSRSHALPSLGCDGGTTAALRRIASSFAHVSDIDCGSCAALPHEDSEDDVREELHEVLIRSEPFKAAVAAAAAGTAATAAASAAAANAASAAAAARSYAGSSAAERWRAERRRGHHHHHHSANDGVDAGAGIAVPTRAAERWNQIACTVSTLFRVRRYPHANPLSELRRLREQRDLLEAFTRPFLCEDGTSAERRATT